MNPPLKAQLFISLGPRAADAIECYRNVFDDFHIHAHRALGDPDGEQTHLWNASLGGLTLHIMGAPGHAPELTEAISIYLDVSDQDTLDRYWEGLLAAGGRELACGWIADPFGVLWQMVPAVLTHILESGDSESIGRAMQAVWSMTKLDAAAIESAAAASGI